MLIGSRLNAFGLSPPTCAWRRPPRRAARASCRTRACGASPPSRTSRRERAAHRDARTARSASPRKCGCASGRSAACCHRRSTRRRRVHPRRPPPHGRHAPRRRAADVRPVEIGRLHTQILGEQQRRRPRPVAGGEERVHVGEREPGLVQRRLGRLRLNWSTVLLGVTPRSDSATPTIAALRPRVCGQRAFAERPYDSPCLEHSRQRLPDLDVAAQQIARDDEPLDLIGALEDARRRASRGTSARWAVRVV